jgi:hypothetical protein
MKKDYFKDGESAVDSIFAEWETQIRKSKDESLNRTFYQLQDSFARFKVELIQKGYKGYFNDQKL